MRPPPPGSTTASNIAGNNETTVCLFGVPGRNTLPSIYNLPPTTLPHMVILRDFLQEFYGIMTIYKITWGGLGLIYGTQRYIPILSTSSYIVM